MAADNPLNVYDFEALARSRMEPGAYDYFAGGAADERTLAENCRAFQRVAFRPHVLIDVSVVDTSTRVLGRPLSFPVMLAPTALNRLGHPDGEVAAASTRRTCECPSLRPSPDRATRGRYGHSYPFRAGHKGIPTRGG